MTETSRQNGASPGFRVFRRRDALYGQTEHMRTTGLDDAMRDNLRRLVETQGPDAAETSYLFGGGGMSLSTAWFKSGYPVVLHTHDADCLYYILSGSLKLGTETLEAGDGVFIPAQVPYTYTAGPEGVEVLEFRTAEHFDIRFTSSSPTYWDKALGTIADRRDAWVDEPRPPRLLSPRVEA